jgi:hypothetical protein
MLLHAHSVVSKHTCGGPITMQHAPCAWHSSGTPSVLQSPLVPREMSHSSGMPLALQS